MDGYVSNIGHDKLIVTDSSGGGDVLSSRFNARRIDAHTLEITIASRDELPVLLERLRDAGVAFVGGSSGWPPAVVFEDLRDRGLVSGLYKEIVFRGTGSSQRSLR
jgi:hypothetical protein